MGHGLGAEYAVVVIGQTGEYLVGAAVEQAYEGDPFFFVVLEADHVGIKLDGSLGHDGMTFD